MMKPTLLRSKKINWPDSLVYFQREMILDKVKQEANHNSGVESLIENQQYINFDGSNISTSFDNYAFSDVERDLLSPSQGENCLVTGVSDHSTTSVNLDTVGETVTIFVGLNLDYEPGEPVLVASEANSTNFLQALVSAYNPSTGELNLKAVDTGGAASGTHTDWEINNYKMRLFTWNGSSWDLTTNVKGHLYPSGLQSWTPLDFTLDLGKTHLITGVWTLYFKYPFDFVAGYPEPNISMGNDFSNLNQVATVLSNNALPATEQQINLDPPVKARYIRFAYPGVSNSVSLNVIPTALAIIGTPTDGLRPSFRDFYSFKKVSRGSRKTFDEFACINSVRENSLTLIQDHYQVSKYQRLFGNDTAFFAGEDCIDDPSTSIWTIDPLLADEYPNDKIGFNPARGGGGYDYDAMLSQMKANGIEPIPVLSRTIPYLNLDGSDQVHSWHIPHDTGGDPEDPMSYKAWASLIFQFTARYGANASIDDALLKVHAGNTKLKGLDYIWAIGLNNESDKDWISASELMTPKAMAAFLSSSIDGHMGLMGPGHGGRVADPAIRFMMNGLIEAKTDYPLIIIKEIKSMRKDAQKYGYPINPLDDPKFIIDVHQYCVQGIGQNSARGGAPVGQTSFLSNTQRIVKILRQECPNAEICITETGYDSTGYDYDAGVASTSRVATPLTPSESVDGDGLNHDSQAKHLMRLLMYAYIGGYDRCFLFTLKDPAFVGGGGYLTTFNMAGLYQKTGPNNKKVSWYAYNMFYQRLSGYSYVSHSINDVNNLHILKLTKTGTGDAYVIWIESNDDSSLVDHVIDIVDKTTADQIDYAFGVNLGNSASLTVTDNTIEIDINEKPTLILAS